MRIDLPAFGGYLVNLPWAEIGGAIVSVGTAAIGLWKATVALIKKFK